MTGAAVLVAVALTACGSVIKPQQADGGTAPAEMAALDRDRHVSTLAKSPGRRLPGAVVSARSDAAERPPFTMASLDPDPEPVLRQPVVPQQAAPSGRAVTQLVSFDTAPFPFEGTVPNRGPFLDAESGARKGHRTARGGVLWQDQTFGDDRVLLHIPAGFDPRRQAVMVVFFHGHGATLERDVRDRQRVAEQITASGANAVLVAPQFAYDARDSSAGKFWTERGFRNFLDEAGRKLASLRNDTGSARVFARMPVVLVAYSGGFVPAAWSLKDMGADSRMRGVLLLDALYGEEEKFATWIGTARSAFFVSAYTRYTQRHNANLKSMLAARGIASGTELGDSLSRGGVSFLATGSDAVHQDYVTQAWTEFPIKDVLARLPELYVRDPDTVASITPRSRRRERSADADPR
ncbi:hypothetical protein GCM10007887_13520 [Methylobacterium haplocladii]|uniref:Alpha/beta hydrolase n=2 Tax=Methylobacterium haplocladii TaxID=1176176 RepID=A0A512IJN3_9HYPH|nr:hypothetical protein MHA02_03110 [Methylobacterium haplocladii]GJD84841.1 hypothetical protein HPGCJGGD_2724 [Methylobacterium haplocladii]GLS58688.1 hypothetical protein GCM10007887_13520 [Methylobacterium haplocladii]